MTEKLSAQGGITMDLPWSLLGLYPKIPGATVAQSMLAISSHPLPPAISASTPASWPPSLRSRPLKSS